MDEIREEFEKEWRFHDGDNYPYGNKRLCTLIWFSKEKKIQKLKDDIKLAYSFIISGEVAKLTSGLKILRDLLEDGE